VGPVVAVVSPWLPLAGGELLSVGLTVVLPDGGRLDVGGRLDAGGGDADEGDVAGLELPDAGADVLTMGSAVLPGLRLAGHEAELVA
jgi:hypothetical protein